MNRITKSTWPVIFLINPMLKIFSGNPSTKKHRNTEMYKYCHYIQYFLM